MTPDDLKQIAQLLSQHETRIVKKIEQKIDLAKEEILKGVADYVGDILTPVLDKYEKRLEHLENHTTHPPQRPSNI